MLIKHLGLFDEQHTTTKQHIQTHNMMPSKTRRNMSYMEFDQASLLFVSSKLLKRIEIKNRKYHFRTYKNCFVASEVIDVMMQQRLVKTREDGVALGIALQKQLGLWSHVVDDHLFADKYLFFRLATDETEKDTTSDDASSIYDFCN